MTRYIIIDDEPIAHDIIKGYCDMLPDMQMMKHCYDAIEALAYLNDTQIDLIFLDLNMPKLKGFAFLKTLNSPPKVIVTTAYKEYALEGYELNIIDYLLKPFSFERFLKAIQKARNTKDISQVRPTDKIEPEAETIFLKSNKKYVQVNVHDILYLESAGNYVKIITTKELITVRATIRDLLIKFPPDYFLRIHKSYVVSKNQIKSIEGNRVFVQDHEIPIGKMYRAKLTDLLR